MLLPQLCILPLAHPEAVRHGEAHLFLGPQNAHPRAKTDIMMTPKKHTKNVVASRASRGLMMHIRNTYDYDFLNIWTWRRLRGTKRGELRLSITLSSPHLAHPASRIQFPAHLISRKPRNWQALPAPEEKFEEKWEAKIDKNIRVYVGLKSLRNDKPAKCTWIGHKQFFVWAIPNKSMMTVAIFIYQQIYCRWMCPGECIIHDMGGEFCNSLAKILHDSFGVNIRITSAGRPQPNGQAESAVRNVKAKMEAFMAEIGNWFSIFISELEKIKKCESGREQVLTKWNFLAP